jgi:thymidylate synthase (FAD)
MEYVTQLMDTMEQFQVWMADHFKLDELPMHEKKAKTSFMRRFAPEGVATGVVWTANVRTLRHVIEARTDPSAEEEIRKVFATIGDIMKGEVPALFSDYDVDNGHWVPRYRKV